MTNTDRHDPLVQRIRNAVHVFKVLSAQANMLTQFSGMDFKTHFRDLLDTDPLLSAHQAEALYSMLLAVHAAVYKMHRDRLPQPAQPALPQPAMSDIYLLLDVLDSGNRDHTSRPYRFTAADIEKHGAELVMAHVYDVLDTLVLRYRDHAADVAWWTIMDMMRRIQHHQKSNAPMYNRLRDSEPSFSALTKHLWLVAQVAVVHDHASPATQKLYNAPLAPDPNAFEAFSHVFNMLFSFQQDVAVFMPHQPIAARKQIIVDIWRVLGRNVVEVWLLSWRLHLHLDPPQPSF